MKECFLLLSSPPPFPLLHSRLFLATGLAVVWSRYLLTGLARVCRPFLITGLAVILTLS